MENQTLREEFEKEIDAIPHNEILQPGYRRRKLLMWCARTACLALLYVAFWEHDWVRKSLYFVAPLNLLSLVVIFAIPYLLKRKIEKTRKSLDALDQPSFEDEE